MAAPLLKPEVASPRHGEKKAFSVSHVPPIEDDKNPRFWRSAALRRFFLSVISERTNKRREMRADGFIS